MANEIEFEHLLIFGIIAFVVYHFFLRRCPFCGLIKSQCGCLRERFTPIDTIQTSLDESINNPSCCISNTAGYTTDPIAIPEAPGFATISAYANPCN